MISILKSASEGTEKVHFVIIINNFDINNFGR